MCRLVMERYADPSAASATLRTRHPIRSDARETHPENAAIQAAAARAGPPTEVRSGPKVPTSRSGSLAAGYKHSN